MTKRWFSVVAIVLLPISGSAHADSFGYVGGLVGFHHQPWGDLYREVPSQFRADVDETTSMYGIEGFYLADVGDMAAGIGGIWNRHTYDFDARSAGANQRFSLDQTYTGISFLLGSLDESEAGRSATFIGYEFGNYSGDFDFPGLDNIGFGRVSTGSASTGAVVVGYYLAQDSGWASGLSLRYVLSGKLYGADMSPIMLHLGVGYTF